MGVDTIARGMAGNAQSHAGTTDYTQLSNKPSINGVTLSGNKTAGDLGILTSPDLPIVNSPAWGCYQNGGNVTPSVALPSFGTPTTAQSFIYTFTAATTGATFTAPNDAMVIDTDGTTTYTVGNSLVLSDLTAGNLYECNFTCYAATVGGNTHNYIVLIMKGYPVA